MHDAAEVNEQMTDENPVDQDEGLLPAKLIVVIGMWLFCGPILVVAVGMEVWCILAIAADPGEMTDFVNVIGGTLILLLLTIWVYLAAAFPIRATRAYRRSKGVKTLAGASGN
jgi:hypothetical protein